MPQVVALYRYPVKGFTPEPRPELWVQPDGRVAGDRVLTFRFADATRPEERDGLDYWPKAHGLALQNFPALAALRLGYDDASRRLRIEHHGDLVVESGLEAGGRERIVDAVTAYVLGTGDGPRLREPGRRPLALVGDGRTARFQDRPPGFVSLHGRASLASLSAVVDEPVDDRRFRSNIVIEGVDAWSELEWRGEVSIGTVAFHAQEPILRCLATHANPDTGDRDVPVLTTLTRRLGHSKPTFGTLLLPAGPGGRIRLGDEVRIAEDRLA